MVKTYYSRLTFLLTPYLNFDGFILYEREEKDGIAKKREREREEFEVKLNVRSRSKSCKKLCRCTQINNSLT